MRRLLRHPALWLGGFVAWFGVLWKLSSEVQHFPQALDFRFSDKLIHFGYFFGGAGLFAAFLYRLKPDAPDWGKIFWLTVLMVGMTGALDEYHQSKVLGRSGNDPADFTADFLGACAGAWVFRRCHRWVA